MPPVVRILGSGGHSLLDDNPCAAPQIGRVDDPFDSVTTLNPGPVALQYREGSARAPGHWYVMATESGQLLPAAGAYNVIVNGAQALDFQAGQFAPYAVRGRVRVESCGRTPETVRLCARPIVVFGLLETIAEQFDGPLSAVGQQAAVQCIRAATEYAGIGLSDGGVQTIALGLAAAAASRVSVRAQHIGSAAQGLFRQVRVSRCGRCAYDAYTQKKATA